MDVDSSVSGDAPTELGLDLDAIPNQTTDAKVDDMFSSLFPEAAAEAPDQTEEVTDESLQESEDTQEQLPSDDDSNIETPTEEEVPEEAAQEELSVELSNVDYDEAKNFKFPVKDSKTGEVNYLTIDQINSEVNRARGKDSALNEVETAKEELATKTDELKEFEARVQNSQAISAGNQQLAAYDNALEQVQAAIKEAVKEEDGNKVSLLNQRRLELENGRTGVEHQIQQGQSELAAKAAERMSEFGFGDLNTDKQRQAAFKDYAVGNIPRGLLSVVNTNPELLAMVEKARLYDKAQTSKTSAKLVGTKKTLKGGSAKAAPKAAQKKSSLQSKIDDMFT